MPDQFAENPVTRRLDLMRELWKDFEKTNYSICRWLLESIEVDMLYGLLAVENTEAAKLPSLFLQYDTSFEDLNTYTEALIRSFGGFLESEEAMKDLQEANIDISSFRKPKENTIKAWLNMMAAFVDHVFPNPETKIIAFLVPSENKDSRNWLDWITELLKNSFPEKVKVMLLDTTEKLEYDKIQDRFPDRIKTLRPNLDMDKAMHEILEEASKNYPNDPGFAFQEKMVALATEVTKKRMSQAESLAERALEITEKQNWPHLAVSVYIVLGNGYLRINDLEKSLENFEKGREKALLTAKADPKLGNHMEVQTIFGLAGCYMGKKDFRSAADVYLEGCPVAKNIPSIYMSLECYRMAAYCFEFEKDHEAAWEYYQKALEEGKKMTDEEKNSSTLAYVGDGLLRVASKVGESRKLKEIDFSMVELLGKDWKSNIIKDS